MHKEVNDKNVRQDYGKKNEKVKCINQIKENSVSATPTSILPSDAKKSKSDFGRSVEIQRNRLTF